MNKLFLIIFVTVYVLMSLPHMLGFGYVVDWVKGATLFQKANVYVIRGLADNYLTKSIASLIVGILVCLYKARR